MLKLTAADIPNPTKLETVIAFALHASPEEKPAMRAVCERAAKLLDAEHLLPDPIAWVAHPRNTPSPEPAATKLLNEPPGALFELENRAALDQTVRTLSRALDVDYTTALGRLQDSVKVGRERMKSKRDTVGDALREAGVKNLDDFSADMELLERRDAQVAKTLEDAQARLERYELDGQGRVKL